MGDRGISWQPAGWLTPVVIGAWLAAIAVVVLGRPDLVVFAAPLIGALAGGWWTTTPTRELPVQAEVSADRVFEGDTVTLWVEVTPPTGIEMVGVSLDTGPGIEARRVSWEVHNGVARGEWELTATRWGRSNTWLELAVRGAGGLLVGWRRCQLPVVATFPSAGTLDAVPRPMELPDLLGVHLGRRRGEGVEFAGIREYQAGDSLRSVNWQVTGRRGRLHVNERLAEQAAKVVVLIDASLEITQPGESTLEASVKGALAVVQAALKRGDRAGVVALGGIIRWMAPGLGRRHLYRVVEALIDVTPGGGTAPSDFAGFPRTVLPAGAAVVVFSPLVDERMINALVDLRRRGFGVVVVDVLRVEPTPRPTSEYDPVAVRMWRIGRRGVRNRLADVGIPVGVWGKDTELEEVLRPMSQRPLLGARR
ncbi:MAG TPA: DUF58 domain-containing protein [Pseudonocardia sp.]